MSLKGGTGITWAELYLFLTGPAGCVEVSWTPGTHVTLRAPHGAEFGTCKAEKPGYVSPKHLALVSNVFGKNNTDFMIWMGKRPPGKAHLTAKRTTGSGLIPPPFLDRTRDAAVAIERSAIRIKQHASKKSITGEAVKQLELAAKALAAWEDNHA